MKETDLRDAVAILSARIGSRLTDEQKEVVYNFKDDMNVFANPGTGKTTTVVAGLLSAKTLHGIPGGKINAMSFTTLATRELEERYKIACKKIGVKPTVQFNTFHSICYKVITEKYPDFTIRSVRSLGRELASFSEFLAMEDLNTVDENMKNVRRVYDVMNRLNGKMEYSDEAVAESYDFSMIRDYITVEKFQRVRSSWFRRNFSISSIPQGDIPASALYLLLHYPEIQKVFRDRYKLMVVDEFQDMSLLYLEVLRLISEKLIVVGDIKQQIYGFNGASPLILDGYRKKFPKAKELNLTQSFRCKDNIVSIANDVIRNNKIKGFQNFKGVSEGGTVRISAMEDYAFKEFFDEIKQKQDVNTERLDVMFLAKNNASIVPIIELLFQEGIMFRTNKFKSVNSLPVLKDLCMLADIAMHSTDVEKVATISKFMPEFKGLTSAQNPIIQLMNSNTKNPMNKDFLKMRYTFSEASSVDIVNDLKSFKDMEIAGATFSESMAPLLHIYMEYIISGRTWLLDRPIEYYTYLVSSITSKKSYTKMIQDEELKESRNSYYTDLNEGVMCYTFHASKGLEADIVFLIDVDNTCIPPVKRLDDYSKKGYALEASRELRESRNLLYVAITRAKSRVNILYTKFSDMSLLLDPDEECKYAYLDKTWENCAVLNDDSDAFKEIMGVKKNAS